MIRVATLVDVEAVVALGRQFRAESYADTLRENPEQMRVLVQHLIESPTGLVIVDDRDGMIVGMLGGFVFDHPISGDRVAIEVFWFVVPSYRGSGLRLLRHMERWAKRAGATLIQMIAPTDSICDLYTRLGFRKIETSFQRVL